MNYCKLYIDADLSQSQLEEIFFKEFFKRVNLPGVEYTLFPNDRYVVHSDIASNTNPVDRSRYYVEIDSDLDVDTDNNNFKAAISKLIISLRHTCSYVVASCDFEEYIFETTGWNWTQEHPIPPT